MAATPLKTRKFWRQVLVDMMVGSLKRSDIAASLAYIEASQGLTAFDENTFGVLNEPAGCNNATCAVVGNPNATSLVSSLDNPWTSADVGKEIHIQGAGPAGGTYVGTIVGATAGQVSVRPRVSTALTDADDRAGGMAIWGFPVDMTRTAATRKQLDSAGKVVETLGNRQAQSVDRYVTLNDDTFVSLNFINAQGCTYFTLATGQAAITFDTQNKASGLHFVFRLINNSGGALTPTWPAWTVLGSSLPVSIAAGKTLVIAGDIWGTTEADVVVSWAVQP